MPALARLFLLLAAVASGSPLFAQPLTRVAATSLRIDATPPATSYSTVRAFAPLTFALPLALVTPPGETRRLFVVEKTGRIWVIPDVTAATPTRALFLDLSSRVMTNPSDVNDERGLLALAFHPNHAANGYFFVWYTLNTTTSAGSGLHDRLARFSVSAGDPNVANPASEQPLIHGASHRCRHSRTCREQRRAEASPRARGGPGARRLRRQRFSRGAGGHALRQRAEHSQQSRLECGDERRGDSRGGARDRRVCARRRKPRQRAAGDPPARRVYGCRSRARTTRPALHWWRSTRCRDAWRCACIVAHAASQNQPIIRAHSLHFSPTRAAVL